MSDIEILLRELTDKLDDVEKKVDRILDIVSPIEIKVDYGLERKEVNK